MRTEAHFVRIDLHKKELIQVCEVDNRGEELAEERFSGRTLGIGRNSAYEAVRQGEIPSVKFGSRILIPRAKLEAMLYPEGMAVACMPDPDTAASGKSSQPPWWASGSRYYRLSGLYPDLAKREVHGTRVWLGFLESSQCCLAANENRPVSATLN